VGILKTVVESFAEVWITFGSCLIVVTDKIRPKSGLNLHYLGNLDSHVRITSSTPDGH